MANLRTPLRIRTRLQVLKEKEANNSSPALRLPPSPTLKRLGFGTGVNVMLYERSPRGTVCRSPWAIKKVNKSHAKGYVGRRLEEEAKILKSLKHPNIIGYRGYKQNPDGTRVLAIENGETSLFDIIENRKDFNEEEGIVAPLEPSEIREVIECVCKALVYLHKKAKLLHGDLKSGNVLVIGNFDNVKLCDFGVALRLDDDLKVIKGQQYVGTQAWSPKEVIDEAEVIDYKADVFALGCIIYETLALEPPHVNKLPELDLSIENEEDAEYDDSDYQDALGSRPELPEELVLDSDYETILSIFYACTEESPEKRPSPEKILEILDKENPIPNPN